MIQLDITMLFSMSDWVILELSPILELGPIQTFSIIQFSPIITGPVIWEFPVILVSFPTNTEPLNLTSLLFSP